MGAAAGFYVGGQVGGSELINKIATISANAIANAATRSAIEGSSFGRNLVAAIPDVVASALHSVGQSVIENLRRPGKQVADNPAAGGGVEYRSEADQRLDNLLEKGVISDDLRDNRHSYSYVYDQIDAGFSDEDISTSFERGDAFRSPAEIAIFQRQEAELVNGLRSSGSFSSGDDSVSGLETTLLGGGSARPSGSRPPAGSGTARRGAIADAVGELVTGPLSPPVLGQLSVDFTKAHNARLEAAIKRLGGTLPGPSLDGSGRNNIFYHNDSLRLRHAALEYNVNGNDGYLKKETLFQYQKALDTAYNKTESFPDLVFGSKNQSYGLRLGNFIDYEARRHIVGLFNTEGIKFGPKEHVSINNRDYGDSEGGRYRIPDIRIGNVIYDGTIANKTSSTAQVKGYIANREKGVVYIVKPYAYGSGRVIHGSQADTNALPRAVQNPRQTSQPRGGRVR